MTDIWKIGQEVQASKFWDASKNGTLFSTNGEGESAEVVSTRTPFVGGGEIRAAKRLAGMCKAMTTSYEQIIQDQNDYLIEIDNSFNEIFAFQDDMEARIKQLEAEIEELLRKKEDGTITEEEEKELEDKTKEVRSLRDQTSAQIKTTQGEIGAAANKAGSLGVKARAEIATDYGNTALEKGQPLAETKDKRKSFWRKAFGGWDKSREREAGKNLVDAGNELLGKVNISLNIDEKITTTSKKSVHK